MKNSAKERVTLSLPVLLLMFAMLLFASCSQNGLDNGNGGEDAVSGDDDGGDNPPLTATLPGPDLADFPSNGTTYYVSCSGSDDSGDGSESNPYATVKKAYDESGDGTTIKIEAGTYNGDDAGLAIRKKNLHFIGINGRPHMKLKESDKPTSYKGIWVIAPGAENISIDNIEFSGAHISDANGANAAGIRIIGANNVKILNCYMHDNQNGILSSVPETSHVVVKNSEFAKNGAGDGQSHGNYFSGSGVLTYAYNYNHDVDNGNILKSRMHVNYILNNKIVDGPDADYTGNYNIDIPDGGVAYVIGNVIGQASYTDDTQYNNQLLEYGAESLHSYDQNALYVVNNTFVNGIDSGKFLFLHDKPGLEVVIRNNIFTGGGAVINEDDPKFTVTPTKDHNFVGDPGYVNATDSDFHLTTSSSDAIDAGVDPGDSRYGFDLTPMMEYVQPVGSQQRMVNGSDIDLGAFEF